MNARLLIGISLLVIALTTAAMTIRKTDLSLWHSSSHIATGANSSGVVRVESQPDSEFLGELGTNSFHQENGDKRGALTLRLDSFPRYLARTRASMPATLMPQRGISLLLSARLAQMEPLQIRQSHVDLAPAAPIGLGDGSSFLAEEITPVSEPATWFAGALMLTVGAWSQRRRINKLLQNAWSRYAAKFLIRSPSFRCDQMTRTSLAAQ